MAAVFRHLGARGPDEFSGYELPVADLQMTRSTSAEPEPYCERATFRGRPQPAEPSATAGACRSSRTVRGVLAQVLGEPVGGEASHVFKRAGLLEQVGGAGHHVEPVVAAEATLCIPVEFQHSVVVAADDQ